MNAFLSTLLAFIGGFFMLIGQACAASPTPFPDLSATSPYYPAILELQQQGIVQGNADGTLGGERSLNRAELVVIIFRAANISTLTSDKKCFPDVREEWFAPTVCAAFRLGIISGYPDGKFRPEREVTAGEAAKIQANALIPTRRFTDLQEALDFLEAEGFILSKVSVNEPINRLEAFERTHRLLQVRSDPLFLEQVDSQGNPFDPEIDPIKNHLGSNEPIYTPWNQRAYDTFLGKEPMVLFFYASWCPLCRNSDETLLRSLPALTGGVIWFKVNYDTEQTLKAKYGITIQDTFVVIDASGKVVSKHSSLSSPEMAQQWNSEAQGQ